MESVKLQVCCLTIILFIAGVYFRAKRERTCSHIIFSVSLWTCVFCIVFDIITVYTVNHLDSVSPVFNRIAHDLFMGSLIMEVGLFYEYCLALIHGDEVSKKRIWISIIPVWVAWLCLVLLPLDYIETPKGNYSWGPAVYTVHTSVAVYIFCIMLELFRYRKKINPKKRYVIILAFCIQLMILIYQTCVPTALMTSMVIMMINLSFFLTVESPDMLLMEKLREEKERADEANAAKSQFLSSMSHEIRTPMNAIVGMTDIVLREELPANVREYLNNIKNSGDGLLTIINDILDFSKIESGKLEIVKEKYEPMSLFHDVSMIFLNRIGEKHIELLYDIDPSMPTRLYGDDQRLRQVVINLMSNAIKYTESGYVRLKVETEVAGEGEINLMVSIEDTGQGIREEDIGKLFTSFQRVDKKKNYKKEGTGLGLAISRQLVELMQGTIEVKSTYGKGSTFMFTIPQKVVDPTPAARLKTDKGQECRVAYQIMNEMVKDQFKKLADAYQIENFCMDGLEDSSVDFLLTDDLSQVSEQERKQIEGAGGKICVLQNPMLQSVADIKLIVINKPLYSLNFCQMLNDEEQVFVHIPSEKQSFTAPQAHILVVDDSELNLKVAKGLLAPYHMQIDTAEDGKQALRMVQEKKYDIVFMDHMMPVMDGIEATEAIRNLEGEYYQKLPIIALSANATSEAREMFVEAQMDDFIAKPVQEKELASCVQKWLPEKLMVVQENADNQTLEGTKEEFTIEGLAVAEGIQNCGSKELFIELLGDFYRLIDLKCTKLQQCVENHMLRDFTIEVHALKNNARMIGATELSKLFYQMEQLGNEEKQEEIEQGMPKLLDLYRSYKNVLSEYGNVSKENLVQVSTETMQQTLMQLHDAVDNFDLDTADMKMKELETYAFPEEMQKVVEQLRAYVADVAMEEIIQLTEDMCAKLSK